MVDTARWMGGLLDTTRLDCIMMPGSHDAGMSELHHCAPPFGIDGITKTQKLSVAQQLSAGSRYFDIRVDFDYGRLVTYHRTSAFGCNGQDLVPVLNSIRDFLAQQPSETVFVKFSHIRDYPGHSPAETKRIINETLNSYPTLMYRNPLYKAQLAQVTLGEARGKAVLLFDYPEYIDPPTGRFRYLDGYGMDSNVNLIVFDVYSNTSDYSTMKNDQLDKWRKHGGMGQGFLFLLSWTLTGSATSGSVEKLAAEANGNLPGVLDAQIRGAGWARPNIVYIDYMNPGTAAAIIGYNF